MSRDTQAGPRRLWVWWVVGSGPGLAGWCRWAGAGGMRVLGVVGGGVVKWREPQPVRGWGSRV